RGGDPAVGGRPERPDPRLHRLRPACSRRPRRGHRGVALGRARLALPAEHPGRGNHRSLDRRTGGPAAGPPASLRRPAQPRPRAGSDGGVPGLILPPKTLARLLLIGLVGVLAQLSFFSQVALFHVSPDVLPALVVSIGLLGGSLTGAVSGFSLGFLLNCLLI